MKQQKSSDKTWIDHNGVSIPYERTTPLERLQERHSFRLAKEAKRISEVLTAYKELVKQLHGEVVDAASKSTGVDLTKSKGNKIWYNFDRSIMVEASAQYTLSFESLLITAAREKFDAFLEESIKSDEQFVVELVKNAFSTTNGKLDPKQVTSLLTYRSKVKNHLYAEACDLIEQSMRRDFSKMYFQVSLRQADGSYSALPLNFSQL